MAPAEDALLLLRLVERHLGSLRGTLDAEVFADEDWGFLAQQTLEKLLKALLVLKAQEPPRSHSLQRLVQQLECCGEPIKLAPELLELDDFAVLARYDADPTPLPADRQRLLALLEALHQELCLRVGGSLQA
ncbi:HEPN domain-containing protein [Synechococcus sp. CBW1004]|jgi:HEPN domain-containing protein|uniref:HEPN domain-containing protein n=1 Tax=Synechococcus sp. CBW1004 TaxID=1353136 RepID=UPI0018CDEABC|nr:HEPN domain-containing protein [Synechococcus sp. CBW1004]QPN62597.1 HEPN domain-containing protein [Synechococcus sp. CBW1004]